MNDFAAFVLSIDWNEPLQVVLIIQTEEEATRIWGFGERPDCRWTRKAEQADLVRLRAMEARLEEWGKQLDTSKTALIAGLVGPFIAAELRNRMRSGQ